MQIPKLVFKSKQEQQQLWTVLTCLHLDPLQVDGQPWAASFVCGNVRAIGLVDSPLFYGCCLNDGMAVLSTHHGLDAWQMAGFLVHEATHRAVELKAGQQPATKLEELLAVNFQSRFLQRCGQPSAWLVDSLVDSPPLTLADALMQYMDCNSFVA